jgi:hypothetical protein
MGVVVSDLADGPDVVLDVAPTSLSTGGWCVKARADQHGGIVSMCLPVADDVTTFRQVLSLIEPIPHQLHEHGWCYFGHGVASGGTPRMMRTAAGRSSACCRAVMRSAYSLFVQSSPWSSS